MYNIIFNTYADHVITPPGDMTYGKIDICWVSIW
jgi:hypothetical protein